MEDGINVNFIIVKVLIEAVGPNGWPLPNGVTKQREVAN